MEKGELKWAIRPKFHMAAHLFLEDIAKYKYNPRFFHTFVDEDQIGRVMKLALACSAQKRAKQVVERWLLGFCLKVKLGSTK